MTASPRNWLVVVALPIAPVSFASPAGWQGAAPLGHRVLIPWRTEVQVGLVVGLDNAATTGRIREVLQVWDDTPWLPPETVEAFLTYAADAHLPVGLLFSDLLAVGWQVQANHRVRAVAGADLSAFGEKVPTSAWQSGGDFPAPLLDKIREQGLLDEEWLPVQPMRRVLQATTWDAVPESAKQRPMLQAAQPRKLSAKGEQAWHWLSEHGPAESASQWARAAAVSHSVVKTVIAQGGAKEIWQEAPPPKAWQWLTAHGPVLSVAEWARGTGISAQQAGTLLAQGWAAFVQEPALPPLLPLPASPAPSALPDKLPEADCWRFHGGKASQRYSLLAPRISRLLAQGRGVMVIAPDQATWKGAWEALSGLAHPSGTEAALLSGQLDAKQREHTWQLLQTGQVRLLIGSYMALAAPLHSPALIIVLEEGSDAYKLPAGSRVFVPDLAQRVARSFDCALAVVGGTPAVESVPWPGVVLDAPRSRVHVVDYAHPPTQPEIGPLSSAHLSPADLGYPISHELARLLRQVQERGRQAALLAPRRGYSALLRCPSCEYTPQCKNCDVPLRFHQETRQLTCHQCGYSESVPDRCDNCGEMMWKARGPGTEWIAGEVATLLGELPVWRYDKDRRDDLSGLMTGESGVVVGTQLLLSHPAPPNLALIGVTLADTWLGVSDFRASERYHRLLRQLTEWHPSRAPLLVVQTFQAEHPALQVLLRGQDTLAYPAAEERVRAELGYPPHAKLAQIEVTAREPTRAAQAAELLAAALFSAGATSAEVLGPAPSPIARLKGMYPYHLMLRTRNDKRLSELLKVLDSRTWPARIRVDVNPRGG